MTRRGIAAVLPPEEEEEESADDASDAEDEIEGELVAESVVDDGGEGVVTDGEEPVRAAVSETSAGDDRR
jgi:hypothetical protein